MKTRLFWILWAAGIAGILSFLLADLSTLIASIPTPAGMPPPALLKLLSLIQPTVLITIAVLVGVGHLPVATMLSGGLTPPLAAYVISANSIFSIATGFLYWRRGLEAAILAHMSAHVVLLVAIRIAV